MRPSWLWLVVKWGKIQFSFHNSLHKVSETEYLLVIDTHRMPICQSEIQFIIRSRQQENI